MNEPRIPFYQVRSFGEKINATFDFVRQNFRHVWKFILAILGPLGAILGICINWLTEEASSVQLAGGSNPFADPAVLTSNILLVVISIMVSMGMLSLLYAFMQVYNSREEGLEEVTWRDLSPAFNANLLKSVKLMLAIFVVMVAMIVVCVLLGLALNLWSLLLIIPAVIILCVCLPMVVPTYMFETTGVWTAIKRGFLLGWKTFGGTLGMLLVFGIIAQLIGAVFAVPWYIGVAIKAVFVVQGETAAIASSGTFTFLTYLFAALLGIGTLVATLLEYIALNYQYAHAAAKLKDAEAEE